MAFEPIYKPFATKPKGQYFSSFTGPLQLAVSSYSDRAGLNRANRH